MGAATPPYGVRIDEQPQREQVVRAYGAWMGDPGLAGDLVQPRDMASDSRRFIVALTGAGPVGCACVWFAEATGHLSGIGVRADHRGRGIGTALTATALQVTATRAGVDLISMHATLAGSRLYRALGFTQVYEHATLSPEQPGRGERGRGAQPSLGPRTQTHTFSLRGARRPGQTSPLRRAAEANVGVRARAHLIGPPVRRCRRPGDAPMTASGPGAGRHRGG